MYCLTWAVVPCICMTVTARSSGMGQWRKALVSGTPRSNHQVTLFVTNKDNKVRCVLSNGKVSTLIDAAPCEPYGVCVAECGRIVVCMSSPGGNNHLAIYSPDDGKKVGEMRGSDTDNKRVMADPYRVIQNGKDFLCG